MTTTQMIISVCSFSFLGFVGMIIYIWTDLKSGVKDSVKQGECKAKMETASGETQRVCDDLGAHYHKSDGKVAVDL